MRQKRGAKQRDLTVSPVTKTQRQTHSTTRERACVPDAQHEGRRTGCARGCATARHNHVVSFIHSFILSFFHSFIHSFILSFIHSFFHSFFHSFILSFFHSFILSFFHSFILSFFHSFILSFFHSGETRSVVSPRMCLLLLRYLANEISKKRHYECGFRITSSDCSPRVDAHASQERTGIGGWFQTRDDQGRLKPWLSCWFSHT